jgi:hypothetical protein
MRAALSCHPSPSGFIEPCLPTHGGATHVPSGLEITPGKLGQGTGPCGQGGSKPSAARTRTGALILQRMLTVVTQTSRPPRRRALSGICGIASIGRWPVASRRVRERAGTNPIAKTETPCRPMSLNLAESDEPVRWPSGVPRTPASSHRRRPPSEGCLRSGAVPGGLWAMLGICHRLRIFA